MSDPRQVLDDVKNACHRLEEGDGDDFLVGALQELCTMLCVGGDHFLRNISSAAFAEQLLTLLGHGYSPDVRILACRGLAILVDSVPRGSEALIHHRHGVATLVDAMRNEVYLLQHDVFAEELLKCISTLSLEGHQALLEHNVLGVLMTVLPTLPEHQRTLGLTCVAHLFSAVLPSDWVAIEPAVVQLQTIFVARVAALHQLTMGSPTSANANVASRQTSDEKTIVMLLQCFAHLVDRLALGSSSVADAASAAASPTASAPLLGTTTQHISSSNGSAGGGAGTFLHSREHQRIFDVVEAIFPSIGHLLECAERTSMSVQVRNAAFSCLTCMYAASPKRLLDSMTRHNLIEILAAATLRALTDTVTMFSPEGLLHPQGPQTASPSSAMGQDQYLVGFLELFLFLLPVANVSVDMFSIVLPHYVWMWGDEYHNRNEYDELLSRRLEREYQHQRRQHDFQVFELQHGSRSYGVSFEHLRHVGRDGSFTRPIFRNPILSGFFHRQAQAALQQCTCPPVGGSVSDADDADNNTDARSHGSSRRSGSRSWRENRLAAARQAAAADSDGDEAAEGCFRCCLSVRQFFAKKRHDNDPSQDRVSAAGHHRRGSGASAASAPHVDASGITLHVAQQRHTILDTDAAGLHNAEEAELPQHPAAPGMSETNRSASATVQQAPELPSAASTAAVVLTDAADLCALAPSVRAIFLSQRAFVRRFILCVVPCVLTVCKSTVNVVLMRHCMTILLRCLQLVVSATTPLLSFAAAAAATPDKAAGDGGDAHPLRSIVAPFAKELMDVVCGILRASSRDVANQLAGPVSHLSRAGERIFGTQEASMHGTPTHSTSYVLTIKGELFSIGCTLLATLSTLFHDQRSVQDSIRDHRMLPLLSSTLGQLQGSPSGQLRRLVAAPPLSGSRCPCHSSLQYLVDETAAYCSEAMQAICTTGSGMFGPQSPIMDPRRVGNSGGSIGFPTTSVGIGASIPPFLVADRYALVNPLMAVKEGAGGDEASVSSGAPDGSIHDLGDSMGSLGVVKAVGGEEDADAAREGQGTQLLPRPQCSSREDPAGGAVEGSVVSAVAADSPPAAPLSPVQQLVHLNAFMDQTHATLSEVWRINPLYFASTAASIREMLYRNRTLAIVDANEGENGLSGGSSTTPRDNVQLEAMLQRLIRYISSRVALSGFGANDAPMVLAMMPCSAASAQPAHPSSASSLLRGSGSGSSSAAGNLTTSALLAAIQDRVSRTLSIKVTPMDLVPCGTGISAYGPFRSIVPLPHLTSEVGIGIGGSNDLQVSCFSHATVWQLQQEIAERVSPASSGGGGVRHGHHPQVVSDAPPMPAPGPPPPHTVEEARLSGDARSSAAGTGGAADGAGAARMDDDAVMMHDDDDSPSTSSRTTASSAEASPVRVFRPHTPVRVTPQATDQTQTHLHHPFVDDEDDGIMDRRPSSSPMQHTSATASAMATSTLAEPAAAAGPRSGHYPPHHSHHHGRGDAIRAEHILLLANGTPLLDVDMTVLDVLIAYCPGSAGSFRRLLDAGVSSSKTQLHRAFLLWSTQHALSFVVCQNPVTPKAPLVPPPSASQSLVPTAAPAAACCACAPYNRVASQWDGGRYVCYPSHYYDTASHVLSSGPTGALGTSSSSNDDGDTEEVYGVMLLAEAVAALLASSKAGDQRSTQAAPLGADSRRLSSALIQDVQTQIFSFALPSVGPLCHIAAHADALDEALASTALWRTPQLYPFELRRKVFAAMVAAKRMLIPKNFSPMFLVMHTAIGANWLAAVALERVVVQGGGAGSTSTMPKKLKVKVSRDAIRTQGVDCLRRFSTCPLPLDVEYQGEPGTGNGPTVEFFTLLAKEIASNVDMWAGSFTLTDSPAGGTGGGHQDDAPTADVSGGEEVAGEAAAARPHALVFKTHSRLFPRLDNVQRLQHAEQHAHVLQSFETLGFLIARVLQDGHVVDLPLHPVFLRRLQCVPLASEDLRVCLASIDSDMEQSLARLEHLSDDVLVACDLYFVLPGDGSVPLCHNGAEKRVRKGNVAEYCQAVRAWFVGTLTQEPVRAVHRAMRQSCVHPRLLQLFHEGELSLLLGGPEGPLWPTTASFRAVVCAAHGYHATSRVVENLIDTVVGWPAASQRLFLQFISGSDRIPIGGLSPKLTIVKKDVDADATPSRASRLRRSGERPMYSVDSAGEASVFGTPPPVMTFNDEEEGTASPATVGALESNDDEAASPSGTQRTSTQFSVNPSSFVSPNVPFHNNTSIALPNVGTAERQEMLDECLPTVNTCFHYLKLPEYSSREILEDRLRVAIHEGQGRFLLS